MEMMGKKMRYPQIGAKVERVKHHTQQESEILLQMNIILLY